MLELIINETELFDEGSQTFVNVPYAVLRLEHSLVSVSKWEAKYKKPFLESPEKHTMTEMIDYIKFMTITQNVKDTVYLAISNKEINQVVEYINDPHSATWFSEVEGSNRRRNREIVTSELIYYWMIAMNIPMECQKWHLNRLLTLIKVCEIKQEKPKSMPKKQVMSNNTALNQARRAKMKSRG